MISKQNEATGMSDDSEEVEEPGLNMDQTPKNLPMSKVASGSDDFAAVVTIKTETPAPENRKHPQTALRSLLDESLPCETKIQLSFSVDRLLSCEQSAPPLEKPPPDRVAKCCENVLFACCAYPSCLVGSQHEIHQRQQLHLPNTATPNYLDFKSVVRPTPIRAIGNNCDPVQLCAPFPTMANSSLLRFHQQQHKHTLSATHPHATSLALSPLMAPLRGLKPLQHPQASQHFSQVTTNRFQAKASHSRSHTDIPASLANNHHHHQHQHQQQQHQLTTSGNGSGCVGGSTNSNNTSGGGGKRKRSWSRAVFSNLQRKGLEIQFQQQKYITKPDRRKLAARLNLTDAQVKVWFQNRRMKWRHTRENLKSGQEKQIPTTATTAATQKAPSDAAGNDKPLEAVAEERRETGYSTDGSSSVEISENDDADDNDDEIDIME